MEKYEINIRPVFSQDEVMPILDALEAGHILPDYVADQVFDDMWSFKYKSVYLRSTHAGEWKDHDEFMLRLSKAFPAFRLMLLVDSKPSHFKVFENGKIIKQGMFEENYDEYLSFWEEKIK